MKTIEVTFIAFYANNDMRDGNEVYETETFDNIVDFHNFLRFWDNRVVKEVWNYS